MSLYTRTIPALVSKTGGHEKAVYSDVSLLSFAFSRKAKIKDSRVWRTF